MKPLLIAIFFIIILPAAVHAEELEMINRPVNTSGLTGLLFTTSPFTVPSAALEISAAAMNEKSMVPHYSLNEIPSVTATLGLTDTMEIALKGSYFRRKGETGTIERGTGDTELSCKWNFFPQTESSSLPALAVLMTGIAPTSDKEAHITGVTHWGARIGLAAGREILWGDHVIGIFSDGQIVVHDLSDEKARDRYGIVNAGLIFPVSKYRNLQMLLEYTIVTGIDRITAEGGDYSAFTPGLRLVTERFNISFGTQFLRKKEAAFDNSSRIIGMMSVKL